MFSAPDGRIALAFTVHGEVVPGGTVRPVPIRQGGRTVTTLAPGRDAEQARRMASWSGKVATAGAEAMHGRDLLTGPLVVRMGFYRPRIKGHFGTGRNAERLKNSAPLYPTTRPDNLKLARLTEDALTGIVWRDDSQVVRSCLAKDFGPARCEIEIFEIEEATVGQRLPEAA